MLLHVNQPDVARARIQAGDIIAYPTEAVYGLGCDPFCDSSVERLLMLKDRNVDKGMILLIATWSQLSVLVAPMDEALLAPVKQTWPGPVTWVFPKAKGISPLISGKQDTVAIRMSAHPVARELCRDIPLISTSANISGYPPAKDYDMLIAQFPEGIDVFYEGALGGLSAPSAIFDVMSGKRLR